MKKNKHGDQTGNKKKKIDVITDVETRNLQAEILTVIYK